MKEAWDLLNQLRQYPPAPPAIRIIETTHIPMKHIADEIVPIPDHPLALWFKRKILRRHTDSGILFMRGKSVMAPGDMLMDTARGIVYCHPLQAAEIRRQLGARK